MNEKRSISLKKTLQNKSKIHNYRLRIIDILRKLTIQKNNKLQCQICGKKFEGIRSIIKHLKIHKIKLKDYYTLYFKSSFEDYCLVCLNKTKFNSFENGYFDYCSPSCVSKSEIIREKFKETCLKHYSCSHPTKDPEVNKKQIISIRKTIDEKNNEIIDKRKNTCLLKYGKEYVAQVKEFKDKSIESFLEYRKTDKYKQKIKENNKKFFKEYIKRVTIFLDYLDLELLEEYNGAAKQYKFKCKKCSSIFIRNWPGIPFDNKRVVLCPTCFPENRSRGEIEVSNFVKEIIGSENIMENDRFIIKPFEIDILIEPLKIAIEYCGLYTHSELNKPEPNYHLNKLNKCLEKGYKLITIFEDEWLFKKEIVKNRLANILRNNLHTYKIGARKCSVCEINAKEKNEFLEKFHLQGKDSSNIKIGAFYEDKLVSIMTFSKGNISKGSESKEGIWELNRFCSDYNYHIPGIASKLLNYFKKNYKWKEVYSYADRRWSNGNLYYKLNFELSHKTEPNYWYFKNYKRIHRFSMRKKSNEPKDVPEWKLRNEQGFFRIWDCGNLKFILKKEKVDI